MLNLESDRLILSPVVHEDAAFMMELANSPGWLKYIGDREIHSLEDAQQFVKNSFEKRYEEFGYGLLKVVLKDAKASIGICGLVKRSYLDFPDLGFALLPPYEGMGLAEESSLSVLNDIKMHNRFKKIYAQTSLVNDRSQFLLKRLGFDFKEEFTPSDSKEQLNLYVLNM